MSVGNLKTSGQKGNNWTWQYKMLKQLDAINSSIINNTTNVNPMTTDAFGRERVSSPLTLFDSSHRFADNGLWATTTATGATSVFNSDQGLVDMNVTGASGSKVIRETTKVFSYQPGKSLLVLSTFVMANATVNLTQRVGYYGDNNGYYLEQKDKGNVSFVERSFVTGAVVNTPVLQEDWNVDPMDGSGPSGITLDLTKAQILFMDLEWLGVGTVRMGFIIDGNFYICHKFHHANLIQSTYITTASLPLRYEITNSGPTLGANTLKQICSTVISEGGYELRGAQQAIGTPITSAKALATAGTLYPMVSIRLKSTRLDAIVVATAISIIGNTSANYNWQVVAAGTTTGGSWVSAGANSSVEYNLTGTSFAGGRTIASGFFTATASTSVSVDILRAALLATQLERDPFTGTAYEFSLILTAGTNTETAFASMDWEEVSR
jgi:hypothetical protein